MIDSITRDKILDVAGIVDVVSEFVTLRKRGVNYIGLCPFHADKTPSFYVSPAKNICKCFSCGEGGSPVYFIMKLEQLSYNDALRFLAKKYHIEVQEKPLTDDEKRLRSDRESMFILNSWAQKYFSSLLYEQEEGRNIGLSYFVERGFREETIRKFQLGYSLDKRNHLYDTALSNGFQKEFLERTGLVGLYDNNAVVDRFRGRVIFPIHTISGKVVGFGGRILKKNDKVAKYVNSPESDIYHKSRELYGIYYAKQAIAKQDKCFLVEGYTDVISMHQSGVENVVATSGTALTKGQIHMIHRITNNVTVIFDGDAPGIKAAIRGIDLLLEEGMNVKIVLLPEGDDPDSFARKHNAFEFSIYIKQNEVDFIQFKSKLLLDEAGTDPIKRASLISDILQSIAVIPDNIVRSVYIKECSNLLEIKEQTLLNELNKLRSIQKNNVSSSSNARYESIPKSVSPVNESTGSNEPSAQLEQANQPKTLKEIRYSPFKVFEEALLRYIVQYGERVLFEYVENDDLKRVYVPEYIHAELVQDDLMLLTPEYKSMLDEAVQQCNTPGFIASRHFLSHAEPLFGQIAIQMMDEKHLTGFVFEDVEVDETLTKKEKEDKERRLLEQMEEFELAIRRDLFAFKKANIMSQINEVNKRIKTLQVEGHLEEAMKLLKELKVLDEIKVALSKELGERIILKM